MTLEASSILHYEEYRGFLKDLLETKSRQNSSNSLRKFARDSGISASHLSRVLAREKRLSATTARKISALCRHTPEESEHFLGLIELEQSEGDPEKRVQVLRRLTVSRRGKARVLELESFRVISDWYHFALLALMKTAGFRAETHWIARRLGIRSLDAKLAMDRLLSLGLARKEEDGQVKPAGDEEISTTDDVPSAFIRENHRQQLKLAEEALSRVPVAEREFNNLTISMSPKNTPKAKRLIREFVEKFNREMETEQGSELYQLNLQFYLLTRDEKRTT